MFVFYTGNSFSLSKKLVAPDISDMNFTQHHNICCSQNKLTFYSLNKQERNNMHCNYIITDSNCVKFIYLMQFEPLLIE